VSARSDSPRHSSRKKWRGTCLFIRMTLAERVPAQAAKEEWGDYKCER